MINKHSVNIMPIVFLLVCASLVFAQTSMQNIAGRKSTCLNGKWKVIVDPVDVGIGEWKSLWKDKKATGKHDFYEYSFDGGPVFDVPGDFNSQLPELKYYESSVWYKKVFSYQLEKTKRLFLHFGAVNYHADVFLNNIKIGEHEGGFTPFQIEITNLINDGDNSLIVRVNNKRKEDGVPGLGFDWFNYGGITRDVNLIETPSIFIEDYFVQLKKGSKNLIEGRVMLNGTKPDQKIIIEIPEANFVCKTNTTPNGFADIHATAELKLWSPENPKLYTVKIFSESDSIKEEIGFRSIEVSDNNILLNGEPIFLKGVNIHEEIPQRKSRAHSESDASTLLNWAKELGCNFVRLAHYPHNENIVRLAEKMGLMIWSEIPVYQRINFSNSIVKSKMESMLSEMIKRDKNRCGIIIWSVSNETSPSLDRDKALFSLARLAKSLDSSRLISSAFNNVAYSGNTAAIKDTIINSLDVIGVNEYLGWYSSWPLEPGNMIWKTDFNKPLIMSEFGGEALYGNHDSLFTASTWSEEYQEQIYRDQIKMLNTIPFLKGTCPWILVDFRSPVRMHPVFQDGWNRKGLISDQGYKKRAWYVMKKFYSEQMNSN